MAQYYISKFIEEMFEGKLRYSHPGGIELETYVADIGELNIDTGKIITRDPFVWFNDAEEWVLSASFPTGIFPVQLAIGRNTESGDERIAFARIKFSDNTPTSWTIAFFDEQSLADLEGKSDDFTVSDIFGYPVDSAFGAFMDVSAAEVLQPFLKDDSNKDELAGDIHKNYQHTREWLLWQHGVHTAAILSTGWGTGGCASYIGYDADGQICRLVTDFGVVEQ